MCVCVCVWAMPCNVWVVVVVFFSFSSLFFLLLLFVYKSTPIIFRQPPLSNIFLLPLDKMVWYCYAALILCVIFIMGIQNVHQMGHPLLEAHQITLFDVVSFVFGAVFQQGTHLFIPSLSGRFVLIVTFVATYSTFASYSGGIFSLLQSPIESIHTIDDLLDSPLTLALKNTPYTREIFLNESHSYLRRVYDEKIQPNGINAWISDEHIGMNRVRTDLFAFLIDAPSAYHAIAKMYTETEKCRLSEIKVFPISMNTITVARNSGYKELIKQRYGICACTHFTIIRTFYFDCTENRRISVLIYIFLCVCVCMTISNAKPLKTTVDAWDWIDISYQSEMVTEKTNMWWWWTWFYHCQFSWNISTCVCLHFWHHIYNGNFLCWTMHCPMVTTLENTAKYSSNQNDRIINIYEAQQLIFPWYWKFFLFFSFVCFFICFVYFGFHLTMFTFATCTFDLSNCIPFFILKFWI